MQKSQRPSAEPMELISSSHILREQERAQEERAWKKKTKGKRKATGEQKQWTSKGKKTVRCGNKQMNIVSRALRKKY